MTASDPPRAGMYSHYGDGLVVQGNEPTRAPRPPPGETVTIITTATLS